ncbi:putative cell wall protein [Colletotrichum karsti]|uniref:Cell wall protein n=1 Tax=Colletotrichum karsti TaxID=1095194 RepID=A0A9P6LGL3_9PEZI|nr:putative cell wall protein [Colletotrichum karsti]KAF9871547.1 putative cell wall protein [Colletotrichum karsti]
MHPTRPLQLLMVASVAQASWFNFHKEEPRDGLIKRQSGTSAAAETTTSAAAVTTTTSAAAVTTTTTAAPATTPTPTTARTTTTPAAATPSASTPAASSTTPVATGESTTLRTSTTSAAGNQDTTSGEASSTPSTTAQPVTSTVKTVIVTTNSEGVATSFTSESTVTSTPGLNQSDSGDSSSGMSTQTRNTVIGVVVGVGGAIVLGALGFVAWRIWGKKKQAEENDGLMEYNNQYGNEAKVEGGAGGSAGTGRTPFQSTLESYHAPSQVNASSNF